MSDLGGAVAEVLAAGPADTADLARLERACLPDPWSEEELALGFGSGALAAWRLVAAGSPADTLGYALFQLLPGECELLRLGVVPAARRRGFGAALTSATLDRLAADGRPVCHLEVRAGNSAARALYERLGFLVVGRRRAYYPDGEDAVRYRREAAACSG